MSYRSRITFSEGWGAAIFSFVGAAYPKEQPPSPKATSAKIISIEIRFFIYILQKPLVRIYFNMMMPGAKGLFTPTSYDKYITYRRL